MCESQSNARATGWAEREPPRHTNRPRCPHCGYPAIVRTTRELSPMYREQLMQCTNGLCGHTYVIGAEVLRTISPSATPNPDVHIPQSTHPCAGAKRPAHG